jgi:hypothetical protein
LVIGVLAKGFVGDNFAPQDSPRLSHNRSHPQPHHLIAGMLGKRHQTQLLRRIEREPARTGKPAWGFAPTAVAKEHLIEGREGRGVRPVFTPPMK